MADPHSHRRPARALGLAAAAVLAVTACSDQTASSDEGATPRTAQSASGAGAATASVTSRADVEIPAQALTQLALGEGFVAFAVVPVGGAQIARPNRVELLDLASRDVRRIATTSWPAGQTDLVRTDGGWVLWEDLERTPSTDASVMRWKVMAHRLADSTTHTLAASDTPSAIPTLAAGGGRLVWTSGGGADGAGGLALHAYETSTGTSRQLASGLPRLTDLAAAPDGAYYTVADPTTGAQVTWRVPWQGGAPSRLDTGGSSRSFRASGSGLASWEDAEAGPSKRLGIARLRGVGASDGSGDGPDQGSGSGLAAGPAYLDAPGASNTAPGRDVVAYFDGQAHVRAVPVASDGSLGTPAPVSADGELLHVPCRITARDREVAYCTEPDLSTAGPPTHITLKVKTVALGQ